MMGAVLKKGNCAPQGILPFSNLMFCGARSTPKPAPMHAMRRNSAAVGIGAGYACAYFCGMTGSSKCDACAASWYILCTTVLLLQM